MNNQLTVLVANPSADVYGSDLQLLESVSAMVDQGWRVVVAVPADGKLSPLIRGRGAEIALLDVPVVRRANLRLRAFARLLFDVLRCLPRMRRLIRSVRPDVVYVNTITIPWWLLVARLCGVPALCHVHEAENKDRRIVLTALTAPLSLATSVVANSRASVDTLVQTNHWLRSRTRLIYNGIAGPPEPLPPADAATRPFHLVVVARLAPRKAPDIAIEAAALLRAQGYDVDLEICGTPFVGYEWYEDQLRRRAELPDLAGRVSFAGYVYPVWPALARASAILAPSLREPFGNAVIEAFLARRPVVASAALGHLETVRDGVTGLLVPVGDAAAMAAAVAELIEDPERAAAIAETGRRTAEERFSILRYRADIVRVISDLAR